MQFDPIACKDLTPVVTTDSSSATTVSAQTESTVTTASTAAMTPAVALTTSGGVTSTPNVTIETQPSKSENGSETLKLQEANSEKMKSSSVTPTVQSVKEVKGTVVDENKSLPPDEMQKMEQNKDPAALPETQPPLSPTGSLHSESGESGTGVRKEILYQSSENIYITNCPSIWAITLKRRRCTVLAWHNFVLVQLLKIPLSDKGLFITEHLKQC